MDVTGYVLCYSKNPETEFNVPKEEVEFHPEDEQNYKHILETVDRGVYIRSISGGKVGEIKIFHHKKYKIVSLGKKEKNLGICQTALDQTVRKNANKEKALEFIKVSGQASNEEIREHLGSLPAGRQASRRSVVRYLDALERDGKVEQVGDIGRGVTYRVK